MRRTRSFSLALSYNLPRMTLIGGDMCANAYGVRSSMAMRRGGARSGSSAAPTGAE